MQEPEKVHSFSSIAYWLFLFGFVISFVPISFAIVSQFPPGFLKFNAAQIDIGNLIALIVILVFLGWLFQGMFLRTVHGRVSEGKYLPPDIQPGSIEGTKWIGKPWATRFPMTVLYIEEKKYRLIGGSRHLIERLQKSTSVIAKVGPFGFISKIYWHES